jgi:hypothetical protein
MAKMTKAEMEAFKKKNFNMKVKVTEAQLNKLRKEGTPTKAIAKYKNDPSMLEALNRFYGKDRVKKAGGGSTGSTSTSSSTGSVRGGPGAKMPKPPAGGPGSKTGRDGRTPASKKTITMGTRTQGNITVNKANYEKNKADFQKRTARAVAVGAAIVPVGRGAMMATAAAKKMAPKTTGVAKSTATKVTSKVKSMATKTSKTPTTPVSKAAPKTVSKFKQSPKAAPKVNPKRSLPPKKGSQ